MKAVSVSQLNNYIKRVVGTDPLLVQISVSGEVSNLTKHASGHWYFNLKDESAKINCFIPSNRISSLRFDLVEGMQIVAHGSVSVYERGGYFSLIVRDIEADGEGALSIAFEKLKQKLDAEGLFSPEHKRKLPEFPRKIGIVTSPTGAAIKDIITTVKRRNTSVDLLLYPCLVQGTDAGETIVEGIRFLNEAYPDLDLLIVGRGGGSQEDLWAFNEEAVARAIYQSAIPVISAVGHERDYLISDYAADLRAPTPTAAAELAVPDLAVYRDAIKRFSPENLFSILEDRLELNELRLHRLHENVSIEINDLLQQKQHALDLLKKDVDSCNPMHVLQQGFSAIKKNGSWISDVSLLNPGDPVEIIFENGTAFAEIKKIEVAHEKN